ncbi:MAG TPA: cache domain-containing protein [Tenuifilaceae bacterium]|nr:cache domain-containing protein [Tenuifilaceae bacterium]HPE18327.1 cache domain-containing protein [Tenuifilaceae bacterium]HPJ45985.1 cache domain-containing protein [Tenuifilaceae bacterium]HPQ34364.1 cache domain-containing protein [Tenuifilaceae bacterium]HRX68306.1 cache domain-containing protein [Tenuifilaceae bacterium]
MAVKRSIRQKILLYILSVFIVFFVITLGYIITNSRKTILKETKEKTELIAQNSAKEIERFFENNLMITRTLTQAFSIYQTLTPEVWQKLYLQMYLPVVKANPHIYILWDSWEYFGFIPGYEKEHGRILMYVLRNGENFTSKIEERSMNGDPEHYGFFKKNEVDAVWEPYADVVQDGSRESRLMTTIASPIKIDNKFMGLIGVDVDLDFIQQLVSNVDLVEGGFAFLVSNYGTIAGHPDKSLVNKNIQDVYPAEVEENGLMERIQNAESFSISRYDDAGMYHTMIFAPVQPPGTRQPWSLVVSIPNNEIMAEANRTLYISIGVGLTGLLIVIVLLILIANNLTRPIVQITHSLKRMALGEISSKLMLKINSGDEIQEMANALNTSIEGLNHKTSFALDIGNGRLTSELELQSDKDILGKSLIDMRNSLKVAHDEEVKRKEEDKKRAWANEGFALFAEILRQHSNSTQELADQIVKNLVKYLETNQAGLFLLNDEDKNDVYFQMVAAFAWDRKKFVSKRVEIGEGLVGACALEKESIVLTEIPNDYVLITSGLGKATPRFVVLVPLKHEDEVLGVIEMASFTVMEEYQIDFLEKVAESIASSILSVKINAKTRFLLEQSQQQAEEMLAQEEEMRQNMEELQATQEEMGRKADEQRQREEAMKHDYEQEIEMLKEQIVELKSRLKE